MNATNKLLLAAALLGASAAAEAKISEGLAARVNNEPIMASDYDKAKTALAEQYAAAMPDFFKQPDAADQLERAALDKLIDESLLKQKAAEQKIKVYERELESGIGEIKKRFGTAPDGTPMPQDKAEAAFREELKREGVTMEEFRERIRRQLMAQKLVQDVVRSRIKPPADAEVKAYFENIQLVLNGSEKDVKGLDAEGLLDLKTVAARFRELTSERLRLRHILFRLKENVTAAESEAAKKKALDVSKELTGGLDFDEAVAKHSEDEESARQGGDLGYIVKGMLPAELEGPAFSMQVGENLQPVKSKFGWHILRLEEKRAAQKLRFENTREDLERLLSQNAFATELTAYLKELRNAAKIQVFLELKKKD